MYLIYISTYYIVARKSGSDSVNKKSPFVSALGKEELYTFHLTFAATCNYAC